MNKIEGLIYNLVKRNPRLKKPVRDLYQLLMSAWPARQGAINDSLLVRPSSFFGFHDKSPWSADDKYLLGNRFNIPNRKVRPDDSVEIGYFLKQDFFPLAVTNTFNWQQGCMLQWIGSTNNIIHNSLEGIRNISIVNDLSGNVVRKMQYPVAAVSPDGRQMLSFNFARLAKYAPGYGYENGTDEEIDVPIPKSHGLTIVYLATGASKQLFTVKDIASVSPDESMRNAYHYFTHCLFSPSSQRFVFYHRWVRDMNFVSTRMFSCDLNGKNLFLFPTTGMVSHIGWKDDEQILAYCSTAKYGDAYVLFKDGDTNYNSVGSGILSSDGHPSFSPADNRYFITDTYPNRFRIITLILMDVLMNNRIDLARLKQPLRFKNELRCDFHPRWNRAGNMICFDSAHTGVRSLCTLDINDILNSIS